ncbi:Rpn family recombination-promoting nuclease/putative transposase [Paenibacillus oenotherae]|uniref:Rpn family recombination-promoting nuclease/putative transposase n=1 Tax=Paenibacillus oenotherae TaxID=1435645 RepID=A0ABS7D6P6_9BACL|nr:Rpn family recombination-promoting nuclease/putative transposase [Paenibacillus oenotherae]MBW7474833.1 Rpn family recombination-promoting nuclease/putative transposase [Paenibacillus oenotherae]
MLELLDPRVDVIFKRIFGSEHNKDVLLAFLNSTFRDAGESPLTEIVLLNPYTEADSPDDKQSIMDIKAKTSKGELLNIEMQLFNPYHMEKRTLFYWSEMYYHQIPKGSNYNILKKCVTINILNYSCLPNNRYHSVFHLREDHTGIPLLDDIEIHVIELTKLNEYAAELEEGGLVNWLLFLKGVNKSNWEVLTMKEPMLKKAMDTLEFLSQDAAARMAYDARMKALSDEKSRIEGAKVETSTEIAAKLLNRGVDLQTIAEATGLSIEEIKALQPIN